MVALHELRVGLLLDSFVVPAWVAGAVRSISGDHHKISLVVLNAAATPRRCLQATGFSRLQTALLDVYRTVDHRHLGRVPDALKNVDISDLLSGVDTMKVTPVQTPTGECFSESDSRAIKALSLDVLLKFGFRNLGGEVLRASRYGVWYCQTGDSSPWSGVPPLFWEVYLRQRVASVGVRVLDGQSSVGSTISQGFSTVPLWSLARGQNQAFWRSAEFIRRALRTTLDYGFSPVVTEVSSGVNHDACPNTMQMLIFWFKCSARALIARLRTLVIRDQWRLLIGDAGYQPPWKRLTIKTCLTPPSDRFWADPFLFVHAGRTHLFFEELAYRCNKGVIACCEVGGNGMVGQPQVVLEAESHLSYPFVFTHAGCVYMVPESPGSGKVSLYQAVAFPDTWKYVRDLLNVPGVDPTLLWYRGKWWLFVNVALPTGSPNDELHVFYSDSLDGEFTPHRRNPVVSDVRRARPAGRIIETGDALYRPSQDCSVTYGHRVVFSRIDTLTEDEYVETPVGQVCPSDLGSGYSGCHTYNAAGSLAVFDAKRPVTCRLLTRRSSTQRTGHRKPTSPERETDYEHS